MHYHGVETNNSAERQYYDPCNPDACPYCYAMPSFMSSMPTIYKDFSGGWCHHYNAQGANNGRQSGLSYVEFLKALESIFLDDWDVYTKLTEDYIDDYTLEVLEFEYILQF